MAPNVLESVELARQGKNPAVICRLPSGWVELCRMQFLPGYCVLNPDPVVSALNDLDREQRAQFLCDMALVGDALLEVTAAYRINYVIAGNSNPYLHAHIVPRYLNEPDEYRAGLPWSYPDEVLDNRRFDPLRDGPLMQKLAAAIQQRLQAET